ncbi:hypothetical protein, partial [Longibacter sp.]|uniref:hypothetical protein n=1 Tax=Longibacter sp. TaxID=2045415 RepID=UPI003EB8FF83
MMAQPSDSRLQAPSGQYKMLHRVAQPGGGYRRASVCDAQSRTGQRSDRRRCPPGSLRGACAQVQRCQWHKRENVVSYLPVADQSAWRKKLQRAYQEPS